MSTPESAIVRKLAEHVLQRVTRKVVRDLQAMEEGLQSGDDSGLANIWDEVCVQVQGEQSAFWDMYLETIQSVAETHVDALKEHELEAAWLNTPEGRCWLREDDNERGALHPCKSDIARLVVDRVLDKADSRESARIRRYLENG